MPRPVPVLRRPDVAAWLAAFAAAVDARDYAAGRALFDDGAAGFGTVAGRYDDADTLERDQWRAVWDRTQGFAFDLDAAVCWASDDLVTVIATWWSTGLDGEAPRHREGRATFALHVGADGLRAVHSHFSMLPGTAA